jgi:phosphate starvation-inducible protein PhoH and related proteins
MLMGSLCTVLVVCGYQHKFKPLDTHQHKLDGLLQSDFTKVVCVTGAAGTGKTFLSCQEAVSQLRHKRKNKIIITRPLVFVENEELGFLPGDMNEKMLPWTLPIFDHMKEFMETTEIKRLVQEGKIEISPLGYMRGRTFKDAFIILDEAQNTTPQQMKMFLTRMGNNSKVVINGDLDQSDLSKSNNGLQDFILRLQSKYVDDPQGLYRDGFGLVQLLSENTYRNDMIRRVLDIYEA